jgi:5-oxoprolinase (ATP-hydrolysing) subunit A
LAVDGTLVAVPARSVCTHGDTPGAVGLARAVRAKLEAAGVTITPFVRSGP